MNAPSTSEPTPAFIRKQYEFAAHIRDPQTHPRPVEIEQRRMAIYRELFYNNVEGFLSSGFPVLRRLLPELAWHALARDFFARHRSHTPLFAEISREFLDYLQNERGEHPEDPPFLLELAHYEWVELALSVSDADLKDGLALADPNGDLLAGVPLLSPLAWNLSYHYPVQRIGPDYQPEQPPAEPTHLVVYRDRQDAVVFLEINPVTQRLLQLIGERAKATGLELLTQIARELDHPDPEVVIEGGRQLLRELRGRDIILGSRR